MNGSLKKGLHFHDAADTPGPGYYHTIDMQSGIYPLSTQKNTLSPSFGKYYSYRTQTKVDDAVPGPGNYSYFDSFTGKGYSSVSKYKSSVGPSMHERTKVSKKVDDTPGPGKYKLPSDFGIYISKHATIESERKKSRNMTINSALSSYRSNRSCCK